jgi:hypothetical protein
MIAQYVLGYGIDGRVSNPSKAAKLLFPSASEATLGPTQLLIQ